MRVAIFGGWDEDSARNKAWGVNEEKQTEIENACRAIGKRLARNKHCVIVGSEKKSSADYHVVHGMLEELAEPKAALPVIEVIEGIESKDPLYTIERDNKKYGRFFSSIRRKTTREPIRSAEKILAVEKADVVITIGGLTDTWTGGIAAIVAKKPVVPIGTFGGASAQLLEAFNSLDHALKSTDNDSKFTLLANPFWDPDCIDTVFDLAGLDGDRVFFAYCSEASKTARAIEKYLKSLGLRVINWANDFSEGKSILDEIHAAISSCKYGVFLFTPDDDPVNEDEKQRTPRDNVIFEAGYFMSAHGRDRTKIIIQKGAKILADYGGHIYIPLEDPNNISTIKGRLRKALGKAPPARPQKS